MLFIILVFFEEPKYRHFNDLRLRPARSPAEVLQFFKKVVVDKKADFRCVSFVYVDERQVVRGRIIPPRHLLFAHCRGAFRSRS